MKIAVVMRGLPGSGKSTFVELLKKSADRFSIHAIDDLHTGSDGDFFWDESQAESLYLLNYANYIRSCSDGIDLVICDCINIDYQSVDMYVTAAKKFGYAVYVVTPDMPSVIEASTRNKHQVSLVQIKDMVSRWENWPVVN